MLPPITDIDDDAALHPGPAETARLEVVPGEAMFRRVVPPLRCCLLRGNDAYSPWIVL
jgi:hypothetical protein